MSDATKPAETVTERYFSVEFAPRVGADPYAYLRLGMPDDITEGYLPPNPSSPGSVGNSTTSPWKSGILLYTTGDYTLKTPKATQTTADSFTVITNGQSLAKLDYTAAQPLESLSIGDATINRLVGPTSVSITHQNAMKANLGTSYSVSLGTDQSINVTSKSTLGASLSLEAALGMKINCGKSWDVKLGSGRAGLTGGGHSEFVKKHEVYSAGEIRLSSSSANAVPFDAWTAWTEKISLAVTVLAAVIPVVLTPVSTLPIWLDWRDPDAENKMKQLLSGVHPTVGIEMGVITLIQAGILVWALLAKIAAVPAAIAAGDSTSNTAVLRLDGSGHSYLRRGGKELIFGSEYISLRNEEATTFAAAVIVLSSQKILLQAGPSSIAIDANGITIDAPNGVKCTAGTASLGLQAAGATLAGTQVKLGPVDAATLATTQAARTIAQTQIAAAKIQYEALKVAESLNAALDAFKG